jgi:hypothetical protein
VSELDLAIAIAEAQLEEIDDLQITIRETYRDLNAAKGGRVASRNQAINRLAAAIERMHKRIRRVAPAASGPARVICGLCRREIPRHDGTPIHHCECGVFCESCGPCPMHESASWGLG